MKRDLDGVLTVITIAAGIVLLAVFIQYVYYENSILAPEGRTNGGSNGPADADE